MKQKTLLLILFLFILALMPISSHAQSLNPTLEFLHIAFWPDFDDPSVLVLMDGRLPADVITETQVTIPLPPEAGINAVAESDPEIGLANIPYDLGDQGVTFTVSPGETFHVEFYTPYSDDGKWRNFTYQWLADMDVMELSAEVQQPETTESMEITPAPVSTRTGTSDGLTYHLLPSRAVPSGTSYAVSFRYSPEGEGSFLADNWILIIAGLGLLLIAVAVTWIVATRSAGGRRRRSNRPRKPQKSRPTSTTKAARFCHNCGYPAEAEDQFCRKCGTTLKK